MLSVTLDWLAFTFKEFTHASETWLSTHTPIETCVPIAPTNGYRSACKSEKGVVRMWNNDRPEMGTHVILSGSCLQAMARDVYAGQAALLQSAIWHGGSITRLDLAVDCKDVAVNAHHIYLQAMAGQSTGTARNFAYMEANDGGETLYIGSRQSERFIRIYNKAVEQGLSGVQWHRFELELKGMVARSVASLLVDNSDWYAVFCGVAKRMANFPALPDYQAFFAGSNVEIGTPKIERQTDTEAWIEKQVLPAVLKLYAEKPDSQVVIRLIDALDFMTRTFKRNGPRLD